jgi:hypothetical protein
MTPLQNLFYYTKGSTIQWILVLTLVKNKIQKTKENTNFGEVGEL